MQRIKRTAVIAGLVVGLGATGVAGVAQAAPGNGLGSPGAAATSTERPAAARGVTQRGGERMKGRATDALAPLVANGTITQAQADAVVQALEAKASEGAAGRRAKLRGSIDAAATALGTTPQELREQLRSGRTIAQIAEANGADVQAVVDAMVAEVAKRVDEKVASGSITREQGDALIERATKRITDRVNNGRPAR